MKTVEQVEKEWRAAKAGLDGTDCATVPDVTTYTGQGSDSTQCEHVKSMDVAVKSAFQALADRIRQGGALGGASTGFQKLDEMLDGLRPKLFYVLGARTGVGKTAVGVTNIGINVARAGHGVACFSLEMTAEEQVMRAVCRAANVQSSRIKSRRLTQLDWAELTKACQEISSLDFTWDDSCGYTVEDLESKIIRLNSARDKPIAMVIIDHVLLIRGTNVRSPRTEQLTHISNRLKVIAKKHNVIVLALTQLNRDSEHREVKNKRPQISDLKGCGTIEEDADAIFLLYRADYYEQDKTQWTNELEFIVAKQRNGRTGSVLFTFDGDTSSIAEIEEQ